MRRGRCSERVPDKARVQLDHVIRIDRKISGLLNGSSKDAGYLFVKRRVDAGSGWAVSRARSRPSRIRSSPNSNTLPWS